MSVEVLPLELQVGILVRSLPPCQLELIGAGMAAYVVIDDRAKGQSAVAVAGPGRYLKYNEDFRTLPRLTVVAERKAITFSIISPHTSKVCPHPLARGAFTSCSSAVYLDVRLRAAGWQPPGSHASESAGSRVRSRGGEEEVPLGAVLRGQPVGAERRL